VLLAAPACSLIVRPFCTAGSAAGRVCASSSALHAHHQQRFGGVMRLRSSSGDAGSGDATATTTAPPPEPAAAGIAGNGGDFDADENAGSSASAVPAPSVAPGAVAEMRGGVDVSRLAFAELGNGQVS
jgi:hypothetical protein